MFNMANERRNEKKIIEKEAKRADELYRDDFVKTMRGLPKEQLVHEVTSAASSLSQILCNCS